MISLGWCRALEDIFEVKLFYLAKASDIIIEERASLQFSVASTYQYHLLSYYESSTVNVLIKSLSNVFENTLQGIKLFLFTYGHMMIAAS